MSDKGFQSGLLNIGKVFKRLKRARIYFPTILLGLHPQQHHAESIIFVASTNPVPLKFSDFDLHPDVLDSLASMGFEQPTPIQEQAIGPTLDGRDIIGVAQTGTGKTAAFVVPAISRILDTEFNGKVQALIIVPTRELAVQIDQNIQGLGYYGGISSIAIYGGGDGAEFDREKKALKEGADIVVATPGRMISHLNMGYADFSGIQFLILDEADRMLDMGFHQDLMRIVKHVNEKRQTLLFSATMPDRIESLAKALQNDPVQIKIAISKPAERVLQGAYIVHDDQKAPLIKQLLSGKKELKSIIVFSSTKRNVHRVYSMLKSAGFNCDRISSDLDQKEREEVLLSFRNRRTQILVATDVVSRGIDIDDIDLVINYDVPGDAEDYVHRVGRTARASAEGVALTFVGQDEQQKFGRIEQLIESEVPKVPVPAEFGPTPEYNPKRGGKGKGRGRGRGKGGSKGGQRRGGGGHRSKGKGGGNR